MLQHKLLKEEQRGMYLFHVMGGLFLPPTHVSDSTKLKFTFLSTRKITLDSCSQSILHLCTALIYDLFIVPVSRNRSYCLYCSLKGKKNASENVIFFIC